MKKIRFVFFITAIVLTLGLFGCEMFEEYLGGNEFDDDFDFSGDASDEGENSNHECDYELISTTEATCESKGVKKYKCSCGKTKEETIPESHTPVTQEKIPASCTKAGREACTYCSECSVILEGGEVIGVLEHTVVIDPATEATSTTPAKTEGKHCSECGYIIVKQQFVFSNDFSTPEKYDGTYAYNSLLKLAKADALSALYKRIDEKADYFHSADIDATEANSYVAAAIEFSDLGLTQDEAIAVWSAYRTDHPLYYWMSTSITYTSSYINMIVDEDYSDADARIALNTRIYSKAERLIKEASSTTKYNIALALHDLIILLGDYAYEADGTTPESDPWAHSIVGLMDKGYGVCESYTETFQMLLNFCGVENIVVSGYAGEPHAWNLIKLDDGEWYWCDLTWDDTPDFMLGISYRYFCVNDTQDLGWMDGPWSTAAGGFLTSHAPNPKVDTGINFNYDLPARSVVKFDTDNIMIRDTFTVGKLTYAVFGYDSVQVVSINEGGEIVIPESVDYNGEIFKVVSIGRINDGVFRTGPIANEYFDGLNTCQVQVTSVTIPKSVVFIWDDALNIDYLENIIVSSDNTVFSDIDGVLFTKDCSVLIKYPSGKTATSYTIPDATVKIATGAFKMFYSNEELNLVSITLGANTANAGIANYGYGYEDSSFGNYEENEWNMIRKYLAGASLIYNKDGSVFASN